jgi:hypothetical protein
MPDEDAIVQSSHSIINESQVRRVLRHGANIAQALIYPTLPVVALSLQSAVVPKYFNANASNSS